MGVRQESRIYALHVFELSDLPIFVSLLSFSVWETILEFPIVSHSVVSVVDHSITVFLSVLVASNVL